MPVIDAMAFGTAANRRRVRRASQTMVVGPSWSDLQAQVQDAILAPADGTIAFSGKVAGKSVVTLRHGADVGNLTSTFEPAVTTRAVGTSIAKGERFAHVEGDSEHCSAQCLHWGLKGIGRDYSIHQSG